VSPARGFQPLFSPLSLNPDTSYCYLVVLSHTNEYYCLVYADWCGPCKAIAPAYEQLARQLTRPNRITFTKINVDQQQDIAKAYGVTAYVTEQTSQEKEADS